jgi:hypothetical protein
MINLFISESIKFLGIELYDKKGLMELLIKFSFNLLVVWFIVRVLYYPRTRRKDYLFTYIVLSVIIFLICILLSSVKLQMGFALGLFAIFGIIRYRTDSIPIKEMTYLFVIIGISIINALANKKISYSELLFTNFVIVFVIYCLEKVWLQRQEFCKIIKYEKIELIKPEKNKELLEDLKQRTGLTINRIEIGEIDFLRDTAKINVYYYGDSNAVNLADTPASHGKDDDDD